MPRQNITSTTEYHGNDTPNHTRFIHQTSYHTRFYPPHHGKDSFRKLFKTKQNKTKLALVFSTGALIPKCNTPISRVPRRNIFQQHDQICADYKTVNLLFN